MLHFEVELEVAYELSSRLHYITLDYLDYQILFFFLLGIVTTWYVVFFSTWYVILLLVHMQVIIGGEHDRADIVGS